MGECRGMHIDLLARKKGRLSKGGEPDIVTAAK